MLVLVKAGITQKARVFGVVTKCGCVIELIVALLKRNGSLLKAFLYIKIAFKRQSSSRRSSLISTRQLIVLHKPLNKEEGSGAFIVPRAIESQWKPMGIRDKMPS